MNHDENLCAEIQSTLPLYVGGDLETKALGEVRAHLVACPACAERALAARAARRELVAALRIESTPGPDLWAGVRAALADEGVLRPLAPSLVGAPSLARPWWRSWNLAAAAAVVAAIACAALWTNDREPRNPEGSTPIVMDPTPSAPRGQLPIAPRIDSDLATDVALVPAAETGGLRRLAPGERQLHDSAPFILSDSPYLYATPPQGGGAMQPVGLQRVGSNAPRW
jgi:anti-sigma factor RsiW